MERAVKEALRTSRFECVGSSSGGSISAGGPYQTDDGIVFVKFNAKDKANVMFEGEFAGLTKILQTNTIRVPRPKLVVNQGGGGGAIVMEFLKFGSSNPSIQEKLGEQLANLHMHNQRELENLKRDESRVTRNSNDIDNGIENQVVNEFGFHIPTCCGYIPLDNSWSNDWTTFYIRQRLQPLIDTIMREHGNRKLREAWSKCLPVLEAKLSKVKNIIPSLLHGDLWSGNFGCCDNEPVIYDPATFYGHSEFDLGIGYMFGGFRKQFHESYHRIIPKSDGFSERKDIYELFHHLNHWAHFGGGYEISSLDFMRIITNS